MPKDPDTLVTVATAANEAEAEWLAAMLRDAGIDAFNATAGYVQMVPWEGIALNQPYRVQARWADAERAMELVTQLRAEAAQHAQEIDWDQVDVGQPEDANAAEFAALESQEGVQDSAQDESVGESEPWDRPKESRRERKAAAIRDTILFGILLPICVGLCLEVASGALGVAFGGTTHIPVLMDLTLTVLGLAIAPWALVVTMICAVRFSRASLAPR
ncbi:MAG: hypothetical protein AAGI30_09935 [Planctomycetota bacterium]